MTSATRTQEHSFTVEDLAVSDLQVDRRVQREALKPRKVEMIKRKFNPDALGVIHVSRRKDRGLYVIDGWHRWEAVRQLTDNEGSIRAHVYEGLSIPQEALMFLDLNYGDQPTRMDKFRVRLEAEDETAIRINENVHAYGWKVTGAPGNGNVNAIAVLERLDELSERIGAEPNLVQVTFLIISRAWGTNKYGAQAVILEGLGRFVAEYSSKINLESLIQKLQMYRGGPEALHAEAGQLARLKKGRVAMSVAELVTNEYNKGKPKNSKSALPQWRKRS